MTKEGPRSRTVIDAYIGERLRLLRMERGISQNELANALQFTDEQVRDYERGTVRISAHTLWTVTRKLDVEVAYFFDGLAENGFH